jgi:HEAT repeat protein
MKMPKLILLFLVGSFLAGCHHEQLSQRQTKKDERTKTVDELMEAFSGAKYILYQKEVAQKLIGLGDKTIIPRIKKHLDTQDRKRKCNAAFVLAGLGDKKGVEIIICELEDTTSRPTDMRRSDGSSYPEGQIRADRYYAAFLLGELGTKQAVPALIEALKDETINYRAAISLGEIGDKSAIPALRKMVNDFPEERLWAGYGLAAMGEPQGFDILREIAINDPKWTERRHAIRALGELGDSKDVPTLLTALQDLHPNIRVSAVRALGAIGDPAAIPALTQALKDKRVTETNAPTSVDKEAQKAIEAIKRNQMYPPHTP